MDFLERDRNTERYWQEQLQHQDWYIKLERYLREKIFPVTDDPEIKRLRQSFYETVEEMLNAGKTPLAKKGPDFDKERKPIDTIVIHHTSEDPDIRLSKLSAIGFVRQYGLDYLEGKTIGFELRGQPIWSNHFKDGKMVFYAYHWLIRPNGEGERLLEDSNVGWQSGNWDINTRSVAISLSGDYGDSVPSKEQLESISKIIKGNYSSVDKNRIFGHREINPNTTCPGSKFLGNNGWKNLLVS